MGNNKQRHKNLDPTVKDKHAKMVKAFIKRQEQDDKDRGLELMVSLLAKTIADRPLEQDYIRKELKALASVMKFHGYTREDYLDVIHWIEGQVGWKLLPMAPIQ